MTVNSFTIQYKTEQFW